MTDDTDTLLVQRAIFGRQVEEFCASDVGRYMIERAIEQKKEAQLDFITADCSNVAQIQQIQNRILVADSIVGWLQDAIGDGLQALNIIEDRG